MTISRRSLLAGSAMAGISLPLVAQNQPRLPRSDSGLVTGKPKALPYEEVAGYLSKEQIRWHHESHYGGALRAFTKLDKAPVGSHRPRTAKANSVILHELYFENMTGDKGDPGSQLAATIKSRFGSVDRWLDDFQAAAKSCRGWAVLSFHPVNGRLYNQATDSHDDGPCWFGVPLLVIDMYEHAYYIDFQNRKADYVTRFAEHIDWQVVSRRLTQTR